MNAVQSRRIPLPAGHVAHVLDVPLTLLDDAHEATRRRIVDVSDAAFGTSTERRWRDKFTSEFLGALARFYLLTDATGALVGWSGYRAQTIENERVVYFTSTGLVPRCQGSGVIPALQRAVAADEARHHPLRPITLAVRTRNPHSYRLALRTFGNRPISPALDGTVPPARRTIVAGIGRWLGFDVDPTTGVVPDAYDVDQGLYGRELRTAEPAINALFERLDTRDALLVLGGRSRAGAIALALAGAGRRLPATHNTTTRPAPTP